MHEHLTAEFMLTSECNMACRIATCSEFAGWDVER